MNWLAHLQKHGYVQLSQFLEPQDANRLLVKLKTNKHPLAWRLLTRPYGPYSSIKDGTLKHAKKKSAHQQAIRGHQRRQFAFSFWRSSNRFIDKNNMNPVLELFQSRLKAKLRELFAQETELTDCFAARFSDGQFIGYHSDGSAGRYAFIYQLSKGWKHKQGGHLVLYPKQIKFYRKLLLPKFNSLALLKLDYPMFHSVKMVQTPAHRQRYTISGWIK